MTKLADGDYTIGIRPHHVSPAKCSRSPLQIDGTVQIAELSGSETMIHFNAYGNAWVSLSHGVHPFRAGEHVPNLVFCALAPDNRHDARERVSFWL